MPRLAHSYRPRLFAAFLFQTEEPSDGDGLPQRGWIFPVELLVLERRRLLAEAPIAQHVNHLLEEAEPEVLVHFVPGTGEILCNLVWQLNLGVLDGVHFAKATITRGHLDVRNHKVVSVVCPHVIWDLEGHRIHRIEAVRGLLVED